MALVITGLGHDILDAVIEYFTEIGYNNANPGYNPHDTGRHGFYQLERNGEHYFAKYSEENTTGIATDIWWYETIQRLRESNDLIIRTPQIVERGDNWYIVEWIDAHPSVAPTGSPEELSRYLRGYALCLTQLDALELDDGMKSTEPIKDNASPYNQPDKNWLEWTKQPLEDGVLTLERLEQAQQLVDRYRTYIQESQSRLQHGDFVPWHILVDVNDDWWLIDGEHASTQKPRYYDLVYMYSRIFTMLHSPEHAAELLREFIQSSKESADEIYAALLPLITSRAIGMHFDAVNDLHGGDGGDYRQDAQDLLTRCLSEDPSRLF